MRSVLTPAARADLIGIAGYIGQASGDLAVGKAFAQALRSKCETLAGLPGELGRPRPELGGNLRSFAFGNYLIVFRYADDLMEVARILERHRNLDALFP